MNKEQKKPQEDWEKKIRSIRESWYEISGNCQRELVYFIAKNFIAKRDLRKLLEEKKRVMAHIVGSKRVETPYVVIDDILAESEKL